MYKNDPPGRTIFDCGSLTFDYPQGVKMSFMQNVFHPASMPNSNQYVYVYGTKGAVDLMNGFVYPAGRGAQPPKFWTRMTDTAARTLRSCFRSCTAELTRPRKQRYPTPGRRIEVDTRGVARVSLLLEDPGHRRASGAGEHDIGLIAVVHQDSRPNVSGI